MSEAKNGKGPLQEYAESGLEKMAGGSSEHVSEHVTEIDRAMQAAREAQDLEQLHEQVRMERLHVAAMALSGILAEGSNTTPVASAIEYADELLEAIIK